MIAEGLGRWAESIASTHGSTRCLYRRIRARNGISPAIRRWTPGLLDEIDGIARGSAQPWQWIYAYNLLDEDGPGRVSWKRAPPPAAQSPGLRRRAATLLAQTMDIPNIHDRTQAVLRIESEDSPAA